MFFLFIGKSQSQNLVTYIDSISPGDTTFFFNEAFVEIDTSSLLTTNFLWDKIAFLAPLQLFDGNEPSQDSLNDATLFQAYFDIKNAAIGSSQYLAYDSLMVLQEALALGYDANPIIILDQTINRIKPDAFGQGLISFNNGILNISGNSSPFEELDVFLAGVLNQNFPVNDTFYMVAPLVNYFGSNGQLLSSVEINFGGGWQNLAWNVPKAFYLTGEEGKFTFEIKLLYSNSTSKVITNNAYKVASCIVPTPDFAPWGTGETQTFKVPYRNISFLLGGGTYGYSGTSTKTRFIKHHLSSTEQFFGKFGKGKVYVQYRPSAINDPIKKFKKPVIIVEGVDFGSAINIVNYFGTQSNINKEADRYSNSIRNGGFGWPELFGCSQNDLPTEFLPDLMTELSNNENDVILLDFKDGADYMQRNGLLLKELINLVNQHKIGNENLVILAPSMGGQVARWTLTKMESQDEDHCVSLFVSLDSPWLGAQIPVSLQYSLKYSAEVVGIAVAMKNFAEINRPAAKQLVLHHHSVVGQNPVTNTNNNIHTHHYGLNGKGEHQLRIDFMNEIYSFGDFPKKCRNIAVANGNINGTTKFSPSVRFFTMNTNCFGSNIKVNLFSLNHTNSLVSKMKLKGHDEYSWNIYGMPNLSGAPGGTRDEDINALRNGLADSKPWYCTFNVPQVNHGTFSFVPTKSSLNISSLNWEDNISGVVDELDPRKSNMTHFEAFHAPDFVDQDHAMVNLTNMPWFLDHLKNGENVLETQNPGTLTKFWNNPLENSALGGIQINNGGILQLNAFDGIYDNSSNDVNPENSLSIVRLGGQCNSTSILDVNDGGKLIIGDDNVNTNFAHLHIFNGAELNIHNGGIVEINKDSKLIVEKGGKLNIQDNGLLKIINKGQIIIEEGGELIYDRNAIINLANYGGVIIFKGKLNIADNADFTFTGLGKLIFDQDIKWGTNASGAYLKLDEFWDIGDNASFVVEGPSLLNENHNLIEVHKSLYLRMEDGTTFDQFTLKNGRVAMFNQTLLFAYSPTVLRFVKFESAIPGNKHNGFRLWNNPGPNSIYGCKFYDGWPSALMHWVGGGDPITFTNCVFEDNIVGLRVEGGNFSLAGCNFNDNYTSIDAKNLTGNSTITATDIIGSNNAIHDGAHIHAQNGASLTVTTSEFSNCIDGLRLGANVTARVTCSDFTLNNRHGIVAATSSVLDIGDEAENIFSGNQLNDIYITGDPQKSAIYLDEGRNNFTARGFLGGVYLRGIFSNGAPSFLGGLNQIQADQNKMPTYVDNGTTIMPVDFTFKLGPSGILTQVAVNIPTNLGTIQPICNSNNTTSSGHIGLYRVVEGFPESTGGDINTEDYPNSDLRNAALDAIDLVSYGEDERDDIEALNRLGQILNASISNSDAYTNRIRAAVYQQMHQALNNAYQHGDLVHAEGQSPVNSSVQNVVGIIDLFIQEIDLTDSTLHFLHFKYNLDKTHVYRVAGNYIEAQSILQSYPSWTHNNTQSLRAQYWECVCTVEQDFYNDEIEEEEYANSLAVCSNQYYGYNYKNDPSFEISQGYRIEESFDTPINFAFYPQPVDEELNIQTSEIISDKIKFTISNGSGVIMQKGHFMSGENDYSLNVKLLAPGMYILNLTYLKDKQENHKFIKY